MKFGKKTIFLQIVPQKNQKVTRKILRKTIYRKMLFVFLEEGKSIN